MVGRVLLSVIRERKSSHLALSDSDFPSLVDIFAPALRRLQRVSGVSSELLFQRIAETLGQELAKAMTSTSLDSVIDELEVLFDSLGLGKISVEKNNSDLTLTINQCLGCEQVPDAEGYANCALREGILKSIFDERLGVNSNVKLLGSHGTEFGAKTCQFAIRLGELR